MKKMKPLLNELSQPSVSRRRFLKQSLIITLAATLPISEVLWQRSKKQVMLTWQTLDGRTHTRSYQRIG
ncbi:MAG: twin-arginine translocation signal domain-containing protein [bacterium]